MSDAYNRRMIIMSFPNLFDGKNADPHLLSKLTTEEELSGIFNVCMMALRRIIVNKGLYINEQTIAITNEERALVKSIVATLSIKRISEAEIIF